MQESRSHLVFVSSNFIALNDAVDSRLIRTSIKVSDPSCTPFSRPFSAQISSPKSKCLKSVSHKNRRTPPSSYQSIEQTWILVAPLHRKDKLRIQRRELLSVGTSVIASLRLRLRFLVSWDLSSSWEATVDGVVEKSSDIVNEEGIQELSDLFFVGELEGTFKGNPRSQWSVSIITDTLQIYSPDSFQMHWANLDNMLLFLALEDTITSASGHTGNIEEFGAINHMIVCSS